MKRGRKRLAWVAWGLALAGVIGAAPLLPEAPVKAVPETLTLKASLERSYSNNPRLLSARKELSIAQAQIREARSIFFPRVNLSLNYIRFRNETLGVTPDDLGNAVLESPVLRSGSLADNLYLGRLGFQQTLYAGGKLRYTYRLSQANLKRAESAYETLKGQVEFDTARAYFELIALQEKEQLLKEFQFELEKASNAAKSDHETLMLAQMRADVRKRLSDLQIRHEQARFDYLQAMGVELFSPVDASGALQPAAVTDTLEATLVRAKQGRAELKQTEIQEEVDQLSIDLSQAERYPVFLLGGGIEARNESFPLSQTNWNTVLSMNIPLFDGFSSWARIRANRFRADQGRLQRARLEDEVERDVRSAYNGYLHWKAEMDQRTNELNALEQVRPSYYSGKKSERALNERLDFLQWVLNARINVLDAKYELCLTTAQLAKSVGRAPVE